MTGAELRNLTSLQERYLATEGWQYMTGLQALVRLPIQQRLRDEAAGWKTGGYISGYRGSPLGRYDMELWQAADRLKALNIVFQPGVNEELAATATWGSQYVGLFAGAQVEGVFSLWYGKAPGMDRAMDPIRHANLCGTSAKGGMVIMVGEDHGAKSSTLANYSDYNFVSTGIPLFYPANAQEVLDFGLHAIAISRYAGCLSGLKLVTDVVEGGGSVHVSPTEPAIVLPDARKPAHIQVVTPLLQQEQLLFNARLDNALAYIRANGINRITAPSPGARVGVIAAGKAWQDLAQALPSLGIHDGIFPGGAVRLLKVGALWPLDNLVIEEFTVGLDTIIVVEEKRPLLEEQIRSILYGRSASPQIVGKYFGGRAYDSRHGEIAFPNDGEINPAMVTRVLARVLSQAYPESSFALANTKPDGGGLKLQRLPSFCAGCPHGRSTQLPEGSRALAGIGCHSMAFFRDPQHTNTLAQMGGEGILWLGQEPFTSEKHVFANMGDGTYFHSGLLAIRAAVAAKTTITYKLLHNGFVSMTGGQPIDGEISPQRMVSQLLAEGVLRIAIVADEPEHYDSTSLADGVTLHPRTDLEKVQQELREVPGVSVLLYDQPCATERRRLRKRGQWADPDKRVFINSAVCEGCGDCGTISHCMAIEPLETEYGRKRAINQSSCNKDFSCVEGFCPSFVTVSGVQPRKPEGSEFEVDASRIPLPRFREIGGSFSILVSGIGGTGVVTIGQTLAVAAHVDGMFSSNLDVTGLAQKYGAVHSHVKFARNPGDLHATRIADGEADTVIGCDLIVTATDETLAKLKSGSGSVVVDPLVSPTGEFAQNPDWRVDAAELQATITKSAEGRAQSFDSHGLALDCFGDAIYENMILLGASWQTGAVPVSHDAMMRAIELGGIKVPENKRAFEVGRWAVHDPQGLEERVRGRGQRNVTAAPLTSFEDIVADRRRFLTEYQNEALADHYEKQVRRIAVLEAQAGLDGSMSREAARNYFKLLASKDEWEVARLYARPQFREELNKVFQGNAKLRFHVGAWPFGRRDPVTGQYRKGEVGGWLLPVFGMMSRLRFLRGSLLDPFRNNAEARLSRRLVASYEADMALVDSNRLADQHEDLTRLLALPEHIRGYGHVRQRHVDLVEVQRKAILASLNAGSAGEAAKSTDHPQHEPV